MKSTMLLCLALTISSCSRKEQEVVEFIQPVKSTIVYNLSSDRERSFSGKVQSSNEIKQSFKITGVLEQLAVDIGSKVQEGDVIAQLESVDLKLKLKEAKSNLSLARTDYKALSSEYNRAANLYANKNISLSELEQARAQSEAAALKIDIAKNNIAQVNRELGYTKMNAKVTGDVIKADIKIGENINANEPVIYIQAADSYEVQVDIPESVISFIKKDDKVKVKFNAIEGKQFNAIVDKIGISSAYTSIYPVTIKLTESNKKIRAGMASTAYFKFNTGNNSNSIYVPTISVGKDDSGNYIFILMKDGEHFKLKKSIIKIGDISDAGIRILEGVKDGDRVLTAGVSKATDGLKVRLLKK